MRSIFGRSWAIIVRTSLATGFGVLGATAYCCLVDWETAPLGMIVGTFVLPQVFLYVLCAWYLPTRWQAHVTYWGWTGILVTAGMWLTRRVPVHEGADELLSFVVQNYVAASVSAYLLLVGWNVVSSPKHEDSSKRLANGVGARSDD
jgi:hypothetical protein